MLDEKFTTDVTDANNPVVNTKIKSYLGTIDKTAGLTLVVRVWCEGTDEDCVNAKLTGKVDVNLVFNGVTMGA